MKRGKRAQFYIIAAIIICTVLIGIAGYYNYVYLKKPSGKFYDLSKNVNLEGAEIIKYGIFNNKEMEPLIEDFTEIFAQYILDTHEKTGLTIITGDEKNIIVRQINETTLGTINVEIGGTTTKVSSTTKQNIVIGNYTVQNRTVQILLPNNVSKEFDLASGQNFLFVLTKSSELEDYVKSSLGEDENI
jgi:hypothetical protein